MIYYFRRTEGQGQLSSNLSVSPADRRQVNGTMYRYVYDGANVAYEFTNGPREGTREPSQGMGLMLGPDNPYGFWTARYSWAGTDFMLNMLRSEAIGWLTTVRNNRGGTLDDCSSDLPESVDWCDYEPIHVGNYFPVLDRQNTVRGYYDMELREGFFNITPLVAMYEYDSFGKPTHEEGLLHSPYRFTGREYDPETGYYFYRARYYDPTLGRFLTQDPVFHNDLYSYVGNNPINFADPYGMNIWDDIQVVIDFAKDPQGTIQKGLDKVMGQPTKGPADENESPESEEEEEEETAPDTPAPPSSTPTGFWSNAVKKATETATGRGQAEQEEQKKKKEEDMELDRIFKELSMAYEGYPNWNPSILTRLLFNPYISFLLPAPLPGPLQNIEGTVKWALRIDKTEPIPGGCEASQNLTSETLDNMNLTYWEHKNVGATAMLIPHHAVVIYKKGGSWLDPDAVIADPWWRQGGKPYFFPSRMWRMFHQFERLEQ